MPKSNAAQRAPAELATGIFGPDWAKWRGATLRVTLADEPPFLARLDEVRSKGAGSAAATLTELDEQLRPVQPRRLPWPPDGEVRVLRTP